MIQRIQTLYLLVAFIAAILFYFFPFSTFFVNPSSFYEFKITAITHFSDNGASLHSIPILMLSLHIILTVLVFISIFMFRNRVRQMRVVAVSFLLNAILIGTIFYFSDTFGKEFLTTPNYKNFGTLMPVLMLVMLLLANKSIKQDEIKMRRSARIR